MGIHSASKQALFTFWYWYVRKLSTVWPYKMVEGRKFIVFPGVYKPLENEHSCAQYCKQNDTVLDLGCGCGVGAIFCADIVKDVLATDISTIAVKNTIKNCKKHNITNVKTLLSDMFAKVDGRFDLIIANPPYIAADFEHEENQFATSVRYLPLLFAGVHDHLEKDGRLLVQYPAWFEGKLLKLADTKGMELVSKKRMPAKSIGLSLISLAYMQVGFRSTYFLFKSK